jgi:hypothetical protein
MSNVTNDCDQKRPGSVEFQKGDTVAAFGIQGKVVETNYMNNFPIFVHFENGEKECFTADGRYKQWHRAPTLIFIERERKATITLTQFRDLMVDVQAEANYFTNRKALDKWMKILFGIEKTK